MLDQNAVQVPIEQNDDIFLHHALIERMLDDFGVYEQSSENATITARAMALTAMATATWQMPNGRKASHYHA